MCFKVLPLSSSGYAYSWSLSLFRPMEFKLFGSVFVVRHSAKIMWQFVPVIPDEFTPAYLLKDSFRSHGIVSLGIHSGELVNSWWGVLKSAVAGMCFVNSETKTLNTPSIPERESTWPKTLLVEPIGSVWFPWSLRNTEDSADSSIWSPSLEPVPWASMKEMSEAFSPALESASLMTLSCEVADGAVIPFPRPTQLLAVPFTIPYTIFPSFKAVLRGSKNKPRTPSPITEAPGSSPNSNKLFWPRTPELEGENIIWRFTPPTIAPSHSLFLIESQAHFMAISDEEQAVSISIVGPFRSHWYATRVAIIPGISPATLTGCFGWFSSAYPVWSGAPTNTPIFEPFTLSILLPSARASVATSRKILCSGSMHFASPGAMLKKWWSNWSILSRKAPRHPFMFWNFLVGKQFKTSVFLRSDNSWKRYSPLSSASHSSASDEIPPGNLSPTPVMAISSTLLLAGVWSVVYLLVEMPLI